MIYQRGKYAVGTTKGFNLIELLIAIFIFITCILFIFGIFPIAMNAVTQGKYVFLATQIAQKELEYLSNLTWNKLDMSNPDIHNRSTQLITTTNGVQSSIVFDSYPVISVDPLQPDIKIVKVTVKYAYGWYSVQPEYVKSVTLETMVYKL